ncbi:uncharacterized protein LOC131944694 [Physella acuta]|uniref:uncharacterized protein LOC131944694 n=1 Tax=Physella acuta TaxID=109671 RepID=UPI0027DE6958|nr:uncharacterized protein LOC131944694 [Physella acuta]
MTFKDVVFMVTSANTTLIEHEDILAEYNMQSTKTVGQHKTPDVTDNEESQTDLLNRVKILEKAIISLQETQQKTEDDMSEMKQWRDNYVTEQSERTTRIEQLRKKQKLNLKNFRKQMSEQDKKVKELNKDIDSLKEKESKSNKTLDKLSLDLKEYENNLLEINKEMKVHTDKTDSVTLEIQHLSTIIFGLQGDSKKVKTDTANTIDKLQLKHSVMYKLLQQRLMLIDKLIQIFNQKFETREQSLKKINVQRVTDMVVIST